MTKRCKAEIKTRIGRSNDDTCLPVSMSRKISRMEDISFTQIFFFTMLLLVVWNSLVRHIIRKQNAPSKVQILLIIHYLHQLLSDYMGYQKVQMCSKENQRGNEKMKLFKLNWLQSETLQSVSQDERLESADRIPCGNL